MKKSTMQNNKIDNINELSFAIFCIENLAKKLGMQAYDLYKLLSDDNDLLHNYIVAGYEFLHTQDKEYILDDIVQEMKLRGIGI